MLSISNFNIPLNGVKREKSAEFAETPQAALTFHTLGLMLPLECDYREILMSLLADVLPTLCELRGKSDLSDKGESWRAHSGPSTRAVSGRKACYPTCTGTSGL